jgi:hypothetical protein
VIAERTGASSRAVQRWASGDAIPLPVYRRLLVTLADEAYRNPKILSIFPG